MLQLKRIYEPYSKEDGYRILIDRLWPRGISKEEAKIDLWLKDIAPSNTLRTWFAHDPAKWNGFQEKYKKELEENTALTNQIKDLQKDHKVITLLYGAKDTEHNNAVALKKYLEE